MTDLTTSILFQAAPELFATPKFDVIDARTGQKVAKGLPRDKARIVRDRLDHNHGAARYSVRQA